MAKMKLVPALSILSMVLMTTPVFAQTSNNYGICTVEDCTVTTIHEHNGKSYAGHYPGDGNDAPQVCTIQNCTNTGTHEHNGKTYFGHHNGDGHTYHSNGDHKSGHGTRHRNGNHH